MKTMELLSKYGAVFVCCLGWLISGVACVHSGVLTRKEFRRLTLTYIATLMVGFALLALAVRLA